MTQWIQACKSKKNKILGGLSWSSIQFGFQKYKTDDIDLDIEFKNVESEPI